MAPTMAAYIISSHQICPARWGYHSIFCLRKPSPEVRHVLASKVFQGRTRIPRQIWVPQGLYASPCADLEDLCPKVWGILAPIRLQRGIWGQGGLPVVPRIKQSLVPVQVL